MLLSSRFLLYACIGYLVRVYSKLGGYLPPAMGAKFPDWRNGMVAFSKVLRAGWLQMVAFRVEKHRLYLTQQKCIGRWKDASLTSEKSEPGNFGPGWIGASTGWPHRLRMGRFGALHGLASEGL